MEESADAFESTDDAGCIGPREADGRMPLACAFMKLKPGSPLIDRGTDVELPFVGAMPDLGAYEFGATPVAGSGGAATGGVAGSSGTDGGWGGGAGAGGAGGPRPSAGGAASGGAVGSGAFPATGGAAQNGPGSGAPASPNDESAASCSCVIAGGPHAAHGALAYLLLAFTFARRRREW